MDKKYLILTISGHEYDKPFILKNIHDLQIRPDNVDYKVYANYKFENNNVEYSDFEYFNEMFYRLKDLILKYDYLMLLDGDDYFTFNKIDTILKLTKNKDYDYIHNKAFYNTNYSYNGINNNNSCITIKTDKINFDLFFNTKSLSDFLLWLPITKNKLYLKDKLTYINLIKMNYYDFYNYMKKRYDLRQNDLTMLYERYTYHYTKEHKIMYNRIKKELSKYLIINDGNYVQALYISFPDIFTYIHRYKKTEWFIDREYNNRYVL